MIVVNNKSELIKLLGQRIEEQGLECDLNDIDVSKVTDMSELFYKSKFSGDISKWDVSNVRNAYGMFLNSKFDGDIRDWNIDISYVEDMYNMFLNSPLEGRKPMWYIIWCGERF